MIIIALSRRILYASLYSLASEMKNRLNTISYLIIFFILFSYQKTKLSRHLKSAVKLFSTARNEYPLELIGNSTL